MSVATESRRGGIDPAALAAASLAAAISVIAPPGPYGPAGMMIGITILLLIFAYDVDPERSKLQSFAFSAVCALILLLALGYPLEVLSASDKGQRLGTLLHEPTKDNHFSEVRPYVVLLFWAGLTGMMFIRDRRRMVGPVPADTVKAAASSI